VILAKPRFSLNLIISDSRVARTNTGLQQLVKTLVLKTAGIAATVLAASMLTAQTVPDEQQQVPSTAGLDLPSNLQIFGNLDPNVRKATAVVNDSVITGTDVDHRVAMIIALNDYKPSAADLEHLKLQVLRSLIDETLQIQEAKTQEITISAPEIDQSFDRVARNFGKSRTEFSAYLRSVGASDRTLRRQIEGELAWNRLLRRKVTPFVNVSDDEVKGILDRLKASQGIEEFHLKEIYLSAPPGREAEVADAGKKMIDQMRGGAPFEYFAGNFSEASTRARQGDLGWVRLTSLPEQLQSAATQLDIGQIAGPIGVPGGFSILYLVDKRKIGAADPRDAKLSLRQIAIKFVPGTTQAQATARTSAFATELQKIRGCGGVAQVASDIGAEVVDNDSVTIRQLPPQLQDIMLKLQVGESTPPFGSPEEGVRALVLCGRDDPQSANLPTADQIQSGLEDQRVNLRAQRMLRDLRRDAVVEYR
jgi:peptidyl-prolyl cis-trans isomerase SurA